MPQHPPACTINLTKPLFFGRCLAINRTSIRHSIFSMATASQVKSEAGIKPDPEDAKPSPAALSDDDIYEDAGDLEFYTDQSAPDNWAGSVYLTHVPKYLYDAWEHLDDDAEIRIGTVRQWNEITPNGQAKPRIAVLLDHRRPEHQNIPKEYNLDVKDMQLINTFLFTEKDLPGYKNKSQGANNNIPPHLRRRHEQSREKPQQDGKDGKDNNTTNAGVKKRYQPYYRKAIPSSCSLSWGVSCGNTDWEQRKPC